MRAPNSCARFAATTSREAERFRSLESQFGSLHSIVYLAALPRAPSACDGALASAASRSLITRPRHIDLTQKNRRPPSRGAARPRAPSKTGQHSLGVIYMLLK